MRFYLAGRYDRKSELRAAARMLEEAGHECGAGWLVAADDLPADAAGMTSAEAGAHAANDLDDIRRCGALISFHEPRPGAGSERGGHHKEFGFALHAGLHLAVIGAPTCVFTHLPGVARLSGVAAAARWLTSLERIERLRLGIDADGDLPWRRARTILTGASANGDHA